MMQRLPWLALAGLLWIAPAIAQTTFTPRDESPEEFAAGTGRDETFYTCTACHGFKLVAQQGLTRAQWEDSINLMIRRHNMPALDDKDRATDSNGVMQPHQAGLWNPQGYGGNAMHRIAVLVG